MDSIPHWIRFPDVSGMTGFRGESIHTTRSLGEACILGLEFLNPALQWSGVWFHPLVLKDEHAGEEKDSSEMRVKCRKLGRPVAASRSEFSG